MGWHMYLWGTSRGASDTPPSCHHLSPLQDCPGSLRIVLLVLQQRTTTYNIITLQSCYSKLVLIVLLVLQHCITSLSSAPGKFWLMFNTQQQFVWIKRGGEDYAWSLFWNQLLFRSFTAAVYSHLQNPSRELHLALGGHLSNWG